MSRTKTRSEQLFEDYCFARRYPFKAIPVLEGQGQFPDYEIETPKGVVICEVKQINPNLQDKEVEKNLNDHGEADYSRPIGKRARSSLVKAAKQLKRFDGDPRPCVVVLFDSTRGGYLDSTDLEAAMFGKPIVLFREGKQHPLDSRSDFTHGGDRKLREDRCLYIGAVAVLHPFKQDKASRLDIYHNPFTSKPVWPACFPHTDDKHFVKDDHPDRCGHGWCEYVGLQR